MAFARWQVVCILMASIMIGGVCSSAGAGLSDWRVQNGKWQVDGGTVTHDDPCSFGGALVRRDVSYRDVSIEASIRIHKEYTSPGQTWAGFLIRASNAFIHGPWLDGYLVFIRSSGEVVLQAMGKGTIGKSKIDSRVDQKAVRLRVELRGDRLRVLADGREVIAATDRTFSSGDVALVSFSSQTSFADLSISGAASKAVAGRAAHTVLVPKVCERVAALPRVAVRAGQDGRPALYTTDTKRRFFPEGFNYTVLGGYQGSEHATFNTDVYDPQRTERALRAMHDLGSNVVRVWAWGGQLTGHGYTGNRESCGLDPRYMENFTDFLRRCTRYGIYVIAILDETPTNRYYDSVASAASVGSPDELVSGYNSQYLCKWSIEAKRAAIRDFIGYVKRSDPGLLNTVLAWALCNESCVSVDTGPFVYTSGKARASTGAYDMSSDSERQACWDRGVVYWANRLTDAVKSVDPQALVAVGMWTSDAHGRRPVNGIRNNASDPRFCPRPSVLAAKDCKIDLLDIHVYPWDGTARVDRAAHEWESVSRSSKPVVVGEYGAMNGGDAVKGREIVLGLRKAAYEMGYQGSLFWVWDLPSKGGTFNAVDDGFGELVAPKYSRNPVSGGH